MVNARNDSRLKGCGYVTSQFDYLHEDASTDLHSDPFKCWAANVQYQLFQPLTSYVMDILPAEWMQEKINQLTTTNLETKEVQLINKLCIDSNVK